MKISKRLTAFAALAVIGSGAGLAFSSASGAAPTPPTAVGNDHVTCDSFIGAGKFSVPIDLVGGQATTLTLKGTIDGCTDADHPTVTFAPSGITITVTYSNNFATTLATPQTVTAAADIKWKFDKASAKTDLKTTHLTWTSQPAPVQNLTLPNLSGAYSESSQPAGSISIGAGQAFTGGNNGASSAFTELLGQSTNALQGQLFDQGVVKGVTVGAGQITVG